MIMAYCELFYQNGLSLLKIQKWLIDANLAIIYLLSNFYIKNNSQFQFDHYIFKYSMNF